MTWFTASVLIAFKPEGYVEGPFQIYENMYLVEGWTSQEALSKAENLGRQEAIMNDGLTIDGQPAFREFLGVRKLISISNPEPLDLDQDSPVDGTEVMYSLYQVSDEDAAIRLAQGEEVDVTYLE